MDWMIFSCEQYKHICGCRCCSVFPLEAEVVERNEDKIVRSVGCANLLTTKLKDGTEKRRYLLMTHSMLCAFLTEDLRCNIYDDRPQVCRNFGNEESVFLCCPFQHADGKIR